MDQQREVNDSQTTTRQDRSKLWSTLGIVDERRDGSDIALTIKPYDGIRQSQGLVHGGILGACLDEASALSAASLEGVVTVRTVFLNVQYLEPAEGSIFSCYAHITKSGKQLAWVESSIHDIDEIEIIRAVSLFRLKRI